MGKMDSAPRFRQPRQAGAGMQTQQIFEEKQ